MPDMTGDQFLEKAKELAPQARRFLLTGYSDMDALIAALNRGQVHRYIAKPWNDEDLIMQVGQAVDHFKMIKENESLLQLTHQQNKRLTELNRELERKVTERSRVLLKAHKELKTTLMGAFRFIISVVEMLNPSLGNYLIHVGTLCKNVAEEMGLEKDAIYLVELAGMFHDIGLIGMPEALLNKAKTDMEPDEYQLYIQHPLLIAICFESTPQLADIGKMIMTHHENYDGSGYPNGISGEEIPLGGRILAVVSDYCRILDTWPVDPLKIIDKATKRYGSELVKDLKNTEFENLLEEVARTVLAMGAGVRYDSAVIESFERVLEKVQTELPRQTRLPVHELKEGMVLAETVLLKDGNSIMSKGIRLNPRLIESLAKLYSHGRIEKDILVNLKKE
jgi:response regulator RpfG family c-di-GMP phosphodiesterase